MKYKGEPNEMLIMGLGNLNLKFNDEGILDLGEYVKGFEKRLMERIEKSGKQKVEEEVEIEKVKEEVVEEEKVDIAEKVYTCKTCGAKIQGMGKYLAHRREHKKDGES